MKVLIIVGIFILSSCTTPQPSSKPEIHDKEMVWEPNRNFWIDKHQEKLELHPIFATMPVETRKTSSGSETRRYVSGGSVKSNEECKGSHCAGEVNTASCNHIFYIKNSKIYNYHRVGPCADYPENLKLRPVDMNANFVVSESEKALLAEVQEHNRNNQKQRLDLASDRSCLTRADCDEGMTCKISESGQRGICVNHGIFGQIFNQ